MTAPTTPFHPTSAAIPKDGEYAGSYEDDCRCDAYIQSHSRLPFIVCGEKENNWYVSACSQAMAVVEAHRARKAKLAESPAMTREEIIETAAKAGYEISNPSYLWSGDVSDETRAHWRLIAEAQLIAVGKIEPLKPAPVKTPGERMFKPYGTTGVMCRRDIFHQIVVTLKDGEFWAPKFVEFAIDTVNAALAAQAAADAEVYMATIEVLRARIVRFLYAEQEPVAARAVAALPLTAGDAK